MFCSKFNILSYSALALSSAIAASIIFSSCSSSSSTGGSWPVLSSPFVTTSTESKVLKGTQAFATTYTERSTALANLLSCGSADERKFTIDVSKGSDRADCYGPQLNYTNHPFDDTSDGQLPVKDLGIWNESNSGTACTAAQITNLVEVHALRFLFSSLVGASLDCYVRNTSSLSLPAEGAEQKIEGSDLSGYGFTNSSGTIALTEAKVVGIAGGYRYESHGTVTPAAANAMEFDSYVQRKDGETDSGTYSFVLKDTHSIEDFNCNDGVADGEQITRTFAGKLTYNTAADGTETLEFSYAEFCNDVDPLDSNYDISTSTTVTNHWVSNFNYGLFNFNPDTFVGSYAYSWQAGSGDESTRTFNASLSADGTGAGYYGFGKAVDDTSYTKGSILGMVCNWAGPGGAISAGPGNRLSATYLQPYVQRQILAKSDAGVWTASANDIRYAPVNSCKYDPAAETTFTFAVPGSTAYTNDKATVAATTEAGTIDLFDFASFSFTIPTRPSF